MAFSTIPLVLTCAFILAAQSPPASPPLQFEVATIRHSPISAGPRPPVRSDPSRVIYNGLTLKIFIQLAFEVPEWKIVGPAWLGGDLYDLAATLPPQATESQIPAMLRPLLAERFHLVLTPDTKQMDIYELRAAKTGAKLKPGDTAEQWSGGTMKGGIFRGRLELHQLSMAGLAEVLSSQTGRPVLDKTGLSGNFDVRLQWTPDNGVQGDENSALPPLYTALQEQLGLKLEAAKMAVPVLVVTHAEKLSDDN